MFSLKNIKHFIYNISHQIDGEIWLFHSITNEKSFDCMLSRCEITPLFFESKIQSALKNGYNFVSMDDVFLYLGGERKIKKFIAVSFDDGYENNYTTAYPILKKYNIPFCIFVTTGFITGEYNISSFEKKKMLSIEQLKCMSADPLCTIGAHTISHPHLRNIEKSLQLDEIMKSRTILQKWTGQNVSFFAPPYGEHNSQIEDLCYQSGFLMSVAAWGGAIRRNKRYNIYNIPRVIIDNM